MSKENKRAEEEKKVVEFNIDETIFEDDKIDQLLRESIKRGADVIEERLNRNPQLRDIEAPAEMFASIVARLKAAGLWEEEMEADQKETHVRLNIDAENEQIHLKTGTDGSRVTSESVYAMLSEEDRHALDLGREIEKKNQRRAERKKKRKKVLGYSSITAAMLVAVFGISMTSEANRRLVFKAWEGAAENMGFRIATNYVDEEKIVQSKPKEDLSVMKEIYEQLGIPAVDFCYLPEGMEYRDYEIMDGISEAIVYYGYKGNLFTVTMLGANEESVAYYFVDSGAVQRGTVKNDQNIEIKIWKINLDEEEETYAAEFVFNDCRYVLNGMLSLEEMKKIAKYMIIL